MTKDELVYIKRKLQCNSITEDKTAELQYLLGKKSRTKTISTLFFVIVTQKRKNFYASMTCIAHISKRKEVSPPVHTVLLFANGMQQLLFQTNVSLFLKATGI